MTSDRDMVRRAAAVAAVAEIESGMSVGVGNRTTMSFAPGLAVNGATMPATTDAGGLTTNLSGEFHSKRIALEKETSSWAFI